MKTRHFLSIENHKANEFQQQLEEILDNQMTFRIRERDFMTDFIFEDCTDEEGEFLEGLQHDFENGTRQIQF
jgi:hypothetical protein